MPDDRDSTPGGPAPTGAADSVPSYGVPQGDAADPNRLVAEGPTQAWGACGQGEAQSRERATEPATAVAYTRLDRVVAEGFPQVHGTSAKDEARLRERATELAMAVAYTWLNRDLDAQEAFLAEIVALNADGAGVVFAVDALTAVRLFGTRPGTARPDTQVTTAWNPPPSLDPEDLRRYCDCVEVVNDLWSGTACFNLERVAAARCRLMKMPVGQVRDVLWIMAYDAACALDAFASFQAAGADLHEDYRREHPYPETSGRP